MLVTRFVFVVCLRIAAIAGGLAAAGCGTGSTISVPEARLAPAGDAAVPGRVRQAAASGSAYPTLVLQDEPAVYYQLSDTALTLTDSGPNHLTGMYGSGIVHGAPPLTVGSAGASTFPGGSYNAAAYTSTPMSAILQPATFTIEAWIKLNAYDASGQPQLLVSYGRPANGSRYGLLLGAANTIRYEQQNTSQQTRLYTYGRTMLVPGTAYHIVVTSDGTNVRIYVNGALDNITLYTGSPNYGDNGGDGLYIGGAPGSNLPTFNGEIAQVSVYPYALSSSQVFNHYLIGELNPPLTERAEGSDAFVDTIGINTHFGYNQSNYWTGFAGAATLLTSLGVRHIRDSLETPRPDPTVFQRFEQLAASGIHAIFITGLTDTQSDIAAAPSLVGNSFEGYEAPNEQDDQHNPNWGPEARAFQQQLYAWVKGNPATAKYPVLGPALVSGASYAELGDVSAYMDYANVHTYTTPYNPGTPGWGEISQYGVYGSLTYAKNLVKVTSENKPVISTETGFGTMPGDHNMVDTRTDLRYIPREFFESFRNGITRTYIYELLDDGGDYAWNNFGIVDTNLTPKPAYTALKSLIGVLSDPGPAFTTGSLTYSLGGNMNNVHHLLMQKRNGSFIVALWLEILDADPVTGADIVAPPQAVTITTASHFTSATLGSLNSASGALSTSSLGWSGTQTTLNVTDQVSLVVLNP